MHHVFVVGFEMPEQLHYHRGHVWTVDVSCLPPLLRGTKRIEQVCGTQGEGWVVSVIFEFHPGPTDRLAYRVVNLWSGRPVLFR